MWRSAHGEIRKVHKFELMDLRHFLRSHWPCGLARHAYARHGARALRESVNKHVDLSSGQNAWSYERCGMNNLNATGRASNHLMVGSHCSLVIAGLEGSVALLLQ